MRWPKYTDLAVVWVTKDTELNKKATTVNVKNLVTLQYGTITTPV
jgi:hypothetical protein